MFQQHLLTNIVNRFLLVRSSTRVSSQQLGRVNRFLSQQLLNSKSWAGAPDASPRPVNTLTESTYLQASIINSSRINSHQSQQPHKGHQSRSSNLLNFKVGFQKGHPRESASNRRASRENHTFFAVNLHLPLSDQTGGGFMLTAPVIHFV